MTIEKFRRAGDEESVTRLERIHLDEVSHVAIGYRWFAYMCARRNINDPIGHFHTLVGQLFRGPLKPPFNEEDRLRAGLSPEWYLPLASSAKRND